MQTSFAQNEKIVTTKDNIDVVYEIKKIDSSSPKKTKYFITVTAVNKNKYTVYYDLAATTSTEGKIIASGATEFVSVKMDNSTGLFKDHADIAGEATTYKTDEAKVLYKIESNKVYTQTTTFNVKTGEKPIVVVSFVGNFKRLEEYNLELLTKNTIDGLWRTDCGSNNILLTYTTAENGKIIILQTVNGKQTRWIQKGADLFVKEMDMTATLIFNKQNGRFLYTSTEGVAMEWIKQ
jgi:hypothetical protein